MESLLYIPVVTLSMLLLATLSVIVIAVNKYLEEKENEEK